jgi:23S rRNA (adenine2503-C2)-methyltransferase
VKGLYLKRPDKKAVKQFRSVLFGSKVVNTCRYTKGDDIAAACGQLALHENEAKKAAEATAEAEADKPKLGVIQDKPGGCCA